MQPDKEFQSLISNLITDVQEISVRWQLAVLFASLGLAWLLQRQFRQGIPAQKRALAER